MLQFKTLRVEEYRLALRNLEQHYQDFLRDSQDSQMFGAEDRMQVESSYNGANRHYNSMVSSAEQGGHRRLCGQTRRQPRRQRSAPSTFSRLSCRVLRCSPSRSVARV